MQYGCLKLIYFSEISGRLSSTGSEILAFGSHCSANFQQILDCFIPKFELKYDNLENKRTDGVKTVVFNLIPIKQSKFFWDTGYISPKATFEHLPSAVIKHLISFHAVKGCNTTSFISGHTKKTARKVFLENSDFLAHVGVRMMAENVLSFVEQFICRL